MILAAARGRLIWAVVALARLGECLDEPAINSPLAVRPWSVVGLVHLGLTPTCSGVRVGGVGGERLGQLDTGLPESVRMP